MPPTLTYFYREVIKNWSPPESPAPFTNIYEILRHKENFKDSYLEHLRKELIGQVVTRGDESCPENIGIITRVGLYGLSCEFLLEKDKKDWYDNLPTGRKALNDLIVLTKLTPKQQERKKLILERIAKSPASQ